MTANDATADDSAQPAAHPEEAAVAQAAAVRPWPATPGALGLPGLIAAPRELLQDVPLAGPAPGMLPIASATDRSICTRPDRGPRVILGRQGAHIGSARGCHSRVTTLCCQRHQGRMSGHIGSPVSATTCLADQD
jgi:hypothetical protein